MRNATKVILGILSLMPLRTTTVSILLAGVSATTFLGGLYSVGCGPPRSIYRVSDKTMNRLNALAQVTIELLRAGCRGSELDTLESTLREARRRDLLNQSEYGDEAFRRDGWDREFHWRVTRQGPETRIEVISEGPNAVFEDGGGDDIVLEIAVVGDAEPKVSVRRP